MKRSLTFLIVAAAALPLAAQTPVPTGAPLVAGQGLENFEISALPGNDGSIEVSSVDVDGPGFQQALHVDVVRDVFPPSGIRLRTADMSISPDDVAFVRFHARAIPSADATGTPTVGVFFAKPTGISAQSMQAIFNVGTEWTEYLLPMRLTNEYAPGEARLIFSFFGTKHAFEIGGLETRYYGRTVAFESLPRTRITYEGRDPGASWRKDALARIEKLRKGDIVVRVVGRDGKPRPDVRVSLEETRSVFEFGSAVAFENLVTDSPDNRIYREKVTELFNAGGPENDLKWPALLGEFPERAGHFSREQALAGLRWLREHDIPARGHVLVWPGWRNLPKQIRDLGNTPEKNEIPQLVREHILDIGTATRDWLVEWDVLNEPFTNHDLMDLFGRDIMIDWFDTAREAMPDVALYLNDFGNHDAQAQPEHVKHFEDTVRFLLDGGAPLDGLGLQAHIFGPPSPPENVLAVLDRYWEEFELPVRVTEFDILTTDEELQADYTRDFFIALFSHPSVVGIQLWGFWEGRHWMPSAAMYRKDWSEKPNAEVYKSLVLDQWRTRTQGVTDADGRYSVRGFYGDYTASVESDGKQFMKTFQIRAGTTPATVEIVVP